MREVLTKSMARNIFYGGSLFFILIFIGLFIHGHWYITHVSTDQAGLTPSAPIALPPDTEGLTVHIWTGERAAQIARKTA